MQIRRPAYFDEFRCIASACPDSCCKEWDVQVDDRAAAYYQALPGGLGDRLRQVMYEEEGTWYFAIVLATSPTTLATAAQRSTTTTLSTTTKRP